MLLLLLPVLLVVTAGQASSVCECGFTLSNTQNNDSEPTWLFTDMIESDFTKMQDISSNMQWVRQAFNVSAEAGRGEYGKSFTPENIAIQKNPHGGDGTDGQEGDGEGTGLVLRVDGGVQDDVISGAEIDTARLDLQWGSYRAGLKLPGVSGTCAAFFWYYNNTQEIDIEFLTREFDRDNKIYPVNLVIQSKQSLEAGYDAQKTGTYQQYNLTFDPTAAFHEYRFDFVPGRVLFYADSVVIGEMEGSAVPTHPGHIILSHWSNGNPLWSGGPPDSDALFMVSYVKAYFNGSDSQRQSDFDGRCKNGIADGKACVVPDVTAVNASTGGSFFSSGKGDDDDSGGGGSQQSPGNDEDKESGGCEEDAYLAMFIIMFFMVLLPNM